MLAVLLCLGTLSAAAPLIFRLIGRRGFYVLALAPVFALVWLLTNYPLTPAQEQTQNWPWIPELDVEIAFRMDGLAGLLSLLVLGVGALVLIYCARYFKDDDDADLGAFAAELLAFCTVMFGLVTADDVVVLFIFWEATTVLSFLLIGYLGHRIYVRRSALQALLVTTAGGLAMLVGLLMLSFEAGTSRISELAQGLAHGEHVLLPAAGVLILAGVASKSALVPFHFWLPGAMAAPTPVSAYLHAAAMVKAGLYLVARFTPLFSPAIDGAGAHGVVDTVNSAWTGLWPLLCVLAGAATMLLGAYRALRQVDIKLILAYGTISQLGFFTILLGSGSPQAMAAGLNLLLAHGLFKAALFLLVGVIDHATGTRDVRELSGLGRNQPILFALGILAAAAMAGLPPTFGFVAKESALAAAWEAEQPLIVAVIMLGSILTFGYTARWVWGAFARKRDSDGGWVADTRYQTSSRLILTSPALLSLTGVVLGALAPLLTPVLRAANTFNPAAAEPLALWHGFTPALWLSLGIIAAGSLLALLRVSQERFQHRAGALLPEAIDAERIYRGVLAGVDELAVAVTGRTQRGSLSFYLVIIFLVAVTAPVGVLLVHGMPGQAEFLWADSPAQVVGGLLMIAAAIAALRAHTRFMALLLVSVTGYGLVLLFALHGAPDLALTQLLVESIVLVTVILGLRTLPPRIGHKDTRRIQLGRLGLGVAFGAGMFLVAVAAMTSRIHQPISEFFPALAVEGGHGANIVNVTLVDLRAWDTFGEITVLLGAATGIASLVFVKYREFSSGAQQRAKTGSIGLLPAPNEDDLQRRAETALAHKFFATERRSWLVGSRTQDPQRRSIIFEVVTRLTFHPIMVISIYLLFAGHNLPGGGFAGGLVAGLALTMRYLVGGRYELEEAISTPAGTVLASGLAVAVAAALTPLAVGGQVFQSAVFELDLGVLGQHSFVTATVFDIGVYLIVIGLVLDVLRTFGSKIDARLESRAAERAAEMPVSDTASAEVGQQ